MLRTEPVTIRLSDYKEPEFLIEHVDLTIDISKKPLKEDAKAKPFSVSSHLTIKINPNCKERTGKLVLQGEKLDLKSVALNGRVLKTTDFTLTDKTLTLENVPDEFTLDIENLADDNSDLCGLYQDPTDGTIIAKSETQNFRLITYFLDSPDVHSSFRTTLIGDEKQQPVLVSNGKLITEAKLPDGKHLTVWNDPVPKPSYLFTVVGGDLECLQDAFITRSGRKLPIKFYVRKGAAVQCRFALDVLKAVMKWDEDIYGHECSVPEYIVVGINKFAAGAIESRGVNIFNIENLLASPASATAMRYLQVAKVIAHEFLHDATGNTVFIRDWFQLALKEAFTTFRDQSFREDSFGAARIRIMAVKLLRSNQFPNDADPVRPEFYKVVRSLYTSSAYEKGAEIFRMLKTVLGDAEFYAAAKQYLRDYKGKSATIENFLTVLQKYTTIDTMQFLLWFTQSGTPTIDVDDYYDEDQQIYTLRVRQPDVQEGHLPLPIPISLGLLDDKGNPMTFFVAEAEEAVMETTLLANKEAQEFHFEVKSCPIPSLLRNFSAPVKMEYPYTDHDLLLLINHDPNLFNRWEASQKFILKQLLTMAKDYRDGKKLNLTEEWIKTYRALLLNPAIDPWVLAEMLTLPTEKYLLDQMQPFDLDAATYVCKFAAGQLAEHLKVELMFITQKMLMLEQVTTNEMLKTSQQRLRNVCMQYTSELIPDYKELALIQFKRALATNMTDTIAALEMVSHCDSPERTFALDAFYQQWQNDPNTINYWFEIQAGSKLPTTINCVKKLMQHEKFDITNPNNVYALIRPFISNPYGLHNSSGLGYQLMADFILRLEKENPPVAARVAAAVFVRWNLFDDNRKNHMFKQLLFLSTQLISPNLKEIIARELSKLPSVAKTPISMLFVPAVIPQTTSAAEIKTHSLQRNH